MRYQNSAHCHRTTCGMCAYLLCFSLNPAFAVWGHKCKRFAFLCKSTPSKKQQAYSFTPGRRKDMRQRNVAIYKKQPDAERRATQKGGDDLKKIYNRINFMNLLPRMYRKYFANCCQSKQDRDRKSPIRFRSIQYWFLAKSC